MLLIQPDASEGCECAVTPHERQLLCPKPTADARRRARSRGVDVLPPRDLTGPRGCRDAKTLGTVTVNVRRSGSCQKSPCSPSGGRHSRMVPAEPGGYRLMMRIVLRPLWTTSVTGLPLPSGSSAIASMRVPPRSERTMRTSPRARCTITSRDACARHVHKANTNPAALL